MKKIVLLLLLCSLFPGIHAQNYKELFENANQCEKMDSLVQAEKYYREALKLEPTNAHNCMIFANLGRLQYRMHKIDDALESYNFALNMAPLTVPILMDRASLLFEMGLTDRAYVDCCTVLDVNKNNAKALFLRAYLQAGRHNYKEAKEDYKRLLELEPESVSGRLGLAILYQQEQDFKNSLELLNKLIVEYPNDAELYVIRAGVEKEIFQLDVALIDLDKAITLSPTSANAFMLRGEILLAQKKKEMARSSFEKAIELGIPRSELMQQLKESK